jgi:putative flippase GtrA
MISAFFRYGLIGVGATFAHYALFWLLVEGFYMPPSPASALGALLGASMAYVGNREFTFNVQHRHNLALVRFMLIAGIAAAISALAVWMATRVGWNYYAAQVLATCVICMLTFQINRAWTFA